MRQKFLNFARLAAKEEATEARQKKRLQTATWAARVFTLLGLAFLLYDIFIVVVVQKGRFDLSDKVLMPVAAMMFVVALVSWRLIHQDHFLWGISLLYFFLVLIPPIMIVLMLQGILLIAILYIVFLSAIMVAELLPVSRRSYTLAGIVAILICLGIERWNPGFRTGSDVGNFALIATLLSGVALLGLSIRQAIVGDILTKLIVAFVSITIFSVGSVALLAQQTLNRSLTANIGDHLNNLAKARSAELGLSVEREYRALKVLGNSQMVQQTALSASQAAPFSAAEISRMDQQWKTADTANNNADPLVANVLNNLLSTELLKFRAQFPQHAEVFLTNLQGLNIASTNRTSDYLQSDEDWWKTAYQNGGYIGSPEYDSSSKTLAINMAVPVRENSNGKIIGMLRSTVNFNILSKTLTDGLFGATGQTSVYLPEGSLLSLNKSGTGENELVQELAPPELKVAMLSTQSYQSINLGGTNKIISSTSITMPGNSGEDAEIIYFLKWRIVTMQDRTEALQPVTTQTRTIIMVAIAIVIGVAFAAFVLARVLTGPITRLNTAAGKVAAGDLTAEAKVETQDEIGRLAATFNGMTHQIRDLVGSLEQRVEERTRALAEQSKALATSTEVSRRLSTILDRDLLVKEVVEQLVTAFDYYYAHIYLYDENKENLRMVGGTGDAGKIMLARGHMLEKGRGLVGRAAETNTAVVISDVSKEPGWLPNDLLPETRSEIAVPISVGNNVLGVFDVQSDQVNGLTEQDAGLLQSIANQVAIALQNANAYVQAKRRAEQEALLSHISQQIQNATTVEEAMKVAVREVGRALHTPAGVRLTPAGKKE